MSCVQLMLTIALFAFVFSLATAIPLGSTSENTRMHERRQAMGEPVLSTKSKVVPALMYYVGASNCIITEGMILDCDGSQRAITTKDNKRIYLLKNELAPETPMKKSVDELRRSVFPAVCPACAKLL